MHRPGSVSVKAVAAELGVAHNSISGRLRREGTTLDRELAKDLLSRISRPMLPREHWRDRLHDLFIDAATECHAHRGLAQVVVGWVGQGPFLCIEFTEQILHLLAAAGLSTTVAERSLDVVVAALCGSLAVEFPNLGAHGSDWEKALSADPEGTPPHRFPLTHRSRTGLQSIAAAKAATALSADLGVRSAAIYSLAQVVIAHIEASRPRSLRD